MRSFLARSMANRVRHSGRSCGDTTHPISAIVPLSGVAGLENAIVERKLAAILAADVVGYSALMERDEKGTFERLKAGRKELFEPEIERHPGRVFKLMGDGLLAEFGSVVDAVECAVALQRGWPSATPRRRREHSELGIGVNLGEVIVEGDDRLWRRCQYRRAPCKQLADPGGDMHFRQGPREVRGKLAFRFETWASNR